MPNIEKWSRRRFLKTALVSAVGATIMPEVVLASSRGEVGGDSETLAKKEGSILKQLAEESGLIEESRLYPFLHCLPEVPADYHLESGKISFWTEADILSQLGGMVVASDSNLYCDKSKENSSEYAVAHQVNLDPKLYGGQIHRGIDLATSDQSGKNTIFLNPVRGRLVSRFSIPRLSPDSPVIQLVDAKDEEITIKLGNTKCFVYMIYGHLKHIKDCPEVGSLIEVGTPLGDITASEKVGGSDFPHTHVEMVAIPTFLLEENNLQTLNKYLINEEWDPRIQYVTYLDTNFIWKFLGGSPEDFSGIDSEIWNISASKQSMKEHYEGK